MYDPNDRPISLIHIQHIIDRIYDRYPLVEKHQIAVVVKAFFEILRFTLLAGDTISIINMFSKMHLYHFSRIQNNKFSRVVKVKLRTARNLKDE